MKILFYGDSITDMGRYRDSLKVFSYGYGYVFNVATELTSMSPLKYDIVNKGVSGDTISMLLDRYENDVIEEKPDVVSILIGINDIWRRVDKTGIGLKAKDFKIKYQELVTNIKAKLPNTKIILCEPFVLEGEVTTPNWEAFSEAYKFAKITKKLAKDNNCYFVEIQSAFDKKVKKIGTTKPILFDGVHPDLLGARIIADCWLKTFKKLEKIYFK